MASFFRAPNDDSSKDSTENSENEEPTTWATGNLSSTDSIPGRSLQTSMALTRLNNDHPLLPNIQPHQHSTLFYLSLIEGRCRTQAASVLNARRRLEERLPEHHPEVHSLAQHLFSEMTKTLHQAGVLPDEFAGQELSELRRNYLSSFDTILQGIATQKQRDFENDNTYSSLFDRSNAFAIHEDLLSASATNAKAFSLQRYNMAPGMLSRLRSLSVQDTPYRKQVSRFLVFEVASNLASFSSASGHRTNEQLFHLK